MPTIFDVVTPKNTVAYFEGTERKQYLGADLFPARKQLGLELSYLKGRGGLPIALQPAAFDALAPLRDRIGVEAINTEMPFFRERMLVQEKERQQINTFLSGNQSEQANLILTEIYKDAENLISGAFVTQERMRMQVLSTGRIQITATAEGRAVNYNYGLLPEQFETLLSADRWTDPTSNPLSQIEGWKLKSGATRAICNGVTFNLLRSHPNVIDAVSGATGKKFVTTTDVKAYFRDELGLSIFVYDEQFQASPTSAPEKFFPDNVFTLIPEGTLGETVYGTTPEESDLMTGVVDAEVELVDQGIAVTTRKHTHPVNVETIVSMINMPSFPMADKVFIATVA